MVRLLAVNVKNCLTPKNPKMCDPILVTLLKVRLHYNQSSPENATAYSATSPLAPHKEVPFTPPPPPPAPSEGEIPRRHSGSSRVCYVLLETFCGTTILKVLTKRHSFIYEVVRCV